MKTIPVMINGLPGKVTTTIATHALADDRFELVPFSLTGPEIEKSEMTLEAMSIRLLRPDNRADHIADIKSNYPGMITIDYTHPSAVNANCDFYCEQQLPFVMGTTGGDRQQLVKAVQQSSICAVIAPNMVKQIVGFQAMLDFAARNFPDMFSGYTLTIRESHQAGKADTSGTAKAMVACFNKLGAAFSADAIQMERDPQRQKTEWGIPEAHLAGHGWHTYTLRSPDDTVLFRFTHNVNGRDIYAAGTLDALVFLKRKVDQGARGRVYSMIDVIK